MAFLYVCLPDQLEKQKNSYFPTKLCSHSYDQIEQFMTVEKSSYFYICAIGTTLSILTQIRNYNFSAKIQENSFARSKLHKKESRGHSHVFSSTLGH